MAEHYEKESMKIDELGEQVVICITQGLSNRYAKVSDNLRDEGLYAYVLYCSSGFFAMTIAASTEKSLSRVRAKIRESERDFLASQEGHPDLLAQFSPSSELYAEITAGEWEYIYSDVSEFEALESVVDEIYEYSYQEVDEDFDVASFLTDRVIEGINNFKELSAFNSELLTGLQFGDPAEDEIKIVEKISSETNQKQWHEKIMKLHREKAKS